MTYCNPGQNSKLYYHFADATSDTLANFDNQIDVSVTTGTLAGTDYNPIGYKISVWLSDPFGLSVGGYGLANLVCRGYTIGTLNPNYGYPLFVLKCDGTYSQAGFILPADITKPIVKDTSVTCSGVIDAVDTITVKDGQTGVVLLTVTGKHPASYKVVCGDECPPGFCKCASTNYPGYCCLPCAQIAAEIAAIAAIARSKK